MRVTRRMDKKVLFTITKNQANELNAGIKWVKIASKFEIADQSATQTTSLTNKDANAIKQASNLPTHIQLQSR